MASTDDAGHVAVGVVEQHAVADLHLVAHEVARLVVAHAVPRLGADALEVVDGERVGFGLHQPVAAACAHGELLLQSSVVDSVQTASSATSQCARSSESTLLRIEGGSDQPWRRGAFVAKGEAAIVPAASHAEPMTALVEAHHPAPETSQTLAGAPGWAFSHAIGLEVVGSHGAGVGGGPSEVVRSTLDPAATIVPLVGFWLITLPTGTVLLFDEVTVPTLSPAPVICAAASA